MSTLSAWLDILSLIAGVFVSLFIFSFCGKAQGTQGCPKHQGSNIRQPEAANLTQANTGHLTGMKQVTTRKPFSPSIYLHSFVALTLHVF
jgi:hypothetical protein